MDSGVTMSIRSIPNPTAIPQPPIPKKREATYPPKEPETEQNPDLEFSAYEDDGTAEENENIEINPNGNPLNARVSKPPKKFNIKTIIGFLIGGVMLFGIGLYIAARSKSATNFDDFYWAIIQANVLLCAGMIVLYSEIKADVYPLVVDRIAVWKMNR